MNYVHSTYRGLRAELHLAFVLVDVLDQIHQNLYLTLGSRCADVKHEFMGGACMCALRA